ncbi:hypothetical protein N8290_04445 [Pseudomonadales bacterium]|nr:hypothetical protein [Pseudomonadales bacterium]
MSLFCQLVLAQHNPKYCIYKQLIWTSNADTPVTTILAILRGGAFGRLLAYYKLSISKRTGGGAEVFAGQRVVNSLRLAAIRR